MPGHLRSGLGVATEVISLKAMAGAFEPYVPDVAVRWGVETPDISHQQIDGTLVFVDISGFTSLSEKLSRRGRRGAEELTSVLNRVFSRMLDIASVRGGSLLKYGGDALLLFFTGQDHVLQACAATVEMRAALSEASKKRTSAGRIMLRMSSGIHTGSIDLFLVGDTHRELIVAGPCASTTANMEHTASASEIVVSDSVRSSLPPDFVGAGVGDGWLLRKRKIDLAPASGIGIQESSNETLTELVPVALREQIAMGIQEAEHRIVTVGFVSYHGLDPLLEKGDYEEVTTELGRLVSTVQRAAASEDVTFLASDLDTDGGKLILVAGAPTSQHDDEGRMLRAARKIIDSQSAFEVRIGVNRGHVFAGDVGADYRRTYTVMGDTVNIAARLMAASPPGHIYATSAALDRSTTLFRTEVLEPLELKGKSQSVQAYSVFEEKGLRDTTIDTNLPFTGRDAELQMLVGIVTTCAVQGRGGTMTVTGDTGLGKSRLIAEVIARCPGLDTLIVQAEPNGSDNPYWAFRNPLRRALGLKRQPQPAMTEALLAKLGKVAPDLLPLAPLLGDVVHIDVADNEETAAIDPQFRPDRTADALIDLLDVLYREPLAVIAEDGHWIDEASKRLLQRLGSASETRPWSIIFTARKEGTGFEALGSEIRLRPLDDDAVRSIAVETTAAAPLRPHELDAVVGRAGGNPLFLGEILSVIRETGDASNLPESLNAVVSTEIDTLRPLSRQFLRYSSVLGRSFRRDVLDELLDTESLQMDTATTTELSQFLEQDGADRLRFRHAVVHDVAYEGLSFRRRRELHRRAGNVIEKMAGDDPDSVAEVLATHFSAGGEHKKVWRFAKVAAAKAKRTYANAEAEVNLELALEAARYIDGDKTGDLVDTYVELGAVRDLMGNYEAARDAYGRALQQATSSSSAAEIYLRRAESWFGSGNLTQASRNITLGKSKVSGSDDPEALRTLARLDAYMSSVYGAKGDPISARTAAMNALDTASRTGEREATARAYSTMDWANFMLGNDEPRRGEEAISIYEDLGMLERSVGVTNNMGFFAYYENDWNKATEWYLRAVEMAERSGNVLLAANARASVAEVLVNQRRYEEALPYAAEAERVARSAGAGWILPFAQLQEARAQIGVGEAPNGVKTLEAIVSSTTKYGRSFEKPETIVHLAEGLLALDDPQRVLTMTAEFQVNSPDAAGEVRVGIMRVTGLAQAELGLYDEAIASATAALDSAIAVGDIYGEALALEARSQARSASGTDPDQTDVERTTQIFDLIGVVRS